MRAAVEPGTPPSATAGALHDSGFDYHIIVGQSSHAGGMCAHMSLLADGLADQSQQVHVWLPNATELSVQSPNIVLHRVLGALSIPDLFRAGRKLNLCSPPRRLLVYWVPHAYGYKAMNLPFCLWIWLRSVFHRDRVELMVQECFLDFSKRSWRQSAAAFVHRVMTIVLLNAADRVWGALPAYKALLRPYTLGRRVPFAWLPVPSNVAVVENPTLVAAIRKQCAAGGLLIGHFGTFGGSITKLLEDIVPGMLTNLDASLVLIGSGSEAFRDRLRQLAPKFAGRIHASGYLEDSTLSSYLNACDVMIQPYPDGVTARRGSILAPLAHARPVVTNPSPRTEPLWEKTGSVALADMTAAAFLQAVRQLKEDPRSRDRLGAAARETYLRYFEPGRMVSAIQHPAEDACAF